MAKTAWRCSQCGTVNEPDARACAECGKWPSLFDLQDDVEELEAFEPEPFEPMPFEAQPFEAEDEVDDQPERSRGRRILTRVIVPVALLLYFLISLLSDR